MAVDENESLNQRYYASLLSQYQTQASSPQKSFRLFDPTHPENRADRLAYPTAIAPESMLKKIPLISYRSLLADSKDLCLHASRTHLWVKKMQAGTGSSVERKQFLADTRRIPLDEVVLGAKGTDLSIELDSRRRVSLAEIQLLQVIHDANEKVFGELSIHDLVSDETQSSVDALWNQPCARLPQQTYHTLFAQSPTLSRTGKTVQALNPTLTQEGEITTQRRAPGGHALFALDALGAAFHPEMRPNTHLPIVSSIGNGEDLSSSPDALMVGYMIKHQIPIAMVTTDKTAIDLKGGQISLISESGEEIYVSIVEQAQAKGAGQLSLFEKIGLEITTPGRKSLFNTNLALFNYSALIPQLSRLVKDVGEVEFSRIASPDLIANWKQQTDTDGITRQYLQLEGAMGSTLLNLDRAWRRLYGEPLVHFINVEEEFRTRFFSPIKTAFDFMLQFHSDRFKLNPKSYRLEDQGSGPIPSAHFHDRYYQDVSHVLKSFKGTKLRTLTHLEVQGVVDFSGMTLSGRYSNV